VRWRHVPKSLPFNSQTPPILSTALSYPQALARSSQTLGATPHHGSGEVDHRKLHCHPLILRPQAIGLLKPLSPVLPTPARWGCTSAGPARPHAAQGWHVPPARVN